MSRVRIAITPSGGTDRRPDRGLTVTATGGTLTKVRAGAGGKAVAGRLNRTGTAWHSTWAFGVGEHYPFVRKEPLASRVRSTNSCMPLGTRTHHPLSLK